MKIESTDYLVVGSGVAGLRAAIELAGYGNVLVITKDITEESSSEYAQGGVAVALSDEDTIGIHFEDTIKAGDGYCDPKAVKILVEEGPERINELISWGAEFDRSGSKLAFTLEAAHSRKRILHAQGDSTGRELVRVLVSKVKTLSNVKRYPFAYILDLVIYEGCCYGAYILKDNEVSVILSKTVILSTGGVGSIFSRTTNPSVATGDGMAIAFRAGAIFENMEFIQFHPTTLYAPSAPQFLLSEALRGEGAKLININKQEFMKNYHPDGELAPRDIVSRAIISEMALTDSRHVYLDITHLNSEFVKRRFPRIYSTCLKYDIDITNESIPVSPSAHYIMGGIKTDYGCATNIKGLMAAGEVACTGVHGANRLASNSLLEGIVFGARAAMFAAKNSIDISDLDKLVFKKIPFAESLKDIDALTQRLKRIMWERVGIIRSEESLTDALDTLKEMSKIQGVWYATRLENEVVNMLQTATLITLSALNRKSSIGSHYRSDFPQREVDYYDIELFKDKDNIKIVKREKSNG
ncbi:MAG: L-aspartate oxidase [Nitrospirae bacterium]|nr:L-aspartate oxidase [Nitrospirota bacterium]MBF0540992.1 L-aspartate oxidase [Nitrospirota bacterium]